MFTFSCTYSPHLWKSVLGARNIREDLPPVHAKQVLDSRQYYLHIDERLNASSVSASRLFMAMLHPQAVGVRNWLTDGLLPSIVRNTLQSMGSARVLSMVSHTTWGGFKVFPRHER